MRVLDLWYDHIDLEQLIKGLPDAEWQRRWRERLAKERARSVVEHDFPKLAAREGKRPKIRDNPPLIFHLPDQENSAQHKSGTARILAYLRNTCPHYRERFSRDIRSKISRLKSLGSAAWHFCLIALLMASDDDPLFLQVKEANASVLEPYAGSSEYKNHGQRVVVGQRFMQAASDVLLGWSTENARARLLCATATRHEDVDHHRSDGAKIRSNTTRRFVGRSSREHTRALRIPP